MSSLHIFAITKSNCMFNTLNAMITSRNLVLLSKVSILSSLFFLVALIPPKVYGQVVYRESGPFSDGLTAIPYSLASEINRTSNTTGWTVIHDAFNSGGFGNTWSNKISLPFTFDFYGVPMNSFLVSKNFLLTFDTALAGASVSALISDNTSLPNSNLPNNTIAYFWDEFAGPSSSIFDDVLMRVHGVAPNRQVWIKNESYRNGVINNTWNHVILEETTNNIYIYDTGNQGVGLGSRTIGVQQNNATAVQTTNSPNEVALSPSSGYIGPDARYWLFKPEPLVTNNLGVIEVKTPQAPLSSGTYPVSVLVQNKGINFILSGSITATVTTSTGTTTIGQVNLSSPLIPGDTATVTIGNVSLINEEVTITAISSSPNGMADNYTDDDTLSATIATTLSGNYTINSTLPTGGTNFNSFSDFTAAYTAYGLGGAVDVQVAPGTGPYNERVTFKDAPGLSAINTISIQGNGNVISFDAGFPNLGIVIFDEARHITLDSLTITTSGNSERNFGVLFTNQADSNRIKNCTIDFSSLLNSNLTSAGIASSDSWTSYSVEGDNAKGLIIENNTIIGGFIGIALTGNTANNANAGNIIRKNSIREFRRIGISCEGQFEPEVYENNITREIRQNTFGFIGVWVENSPSFKVFRNRIHNTYVDTSDSGACIGIYCSNSDGTAGNENLVYNNIVYNFNGSGDIQAFYNLSSDYTKYYHNSISLDYQGDASRETFGFYQNGTATGIDFRNNLISITRSGVLEKHGIYLDDPSTSITANNNVIYVDDVGTSGHFGYFNGNQTTLADWQSANGGVYGSNSTDVNPLVLGASIGDLVPYGNAADETGANLLSVVPTDINGVNRDSVPDIGAVEFNAPVSTLKFAGVGGLSNSANCFGNNETVQFFISNLKDTADFSVDSLVLHYEISGPAYYSGQITDNSSVLLSGDTNTYTVSGLDLTLPGEYFINAFFTYAGDPFVYDDTLGIQTFGMQNIQLIPDSSHVLLDDPYSIRVLHPFLVPGIRITEILQDISAYSFTPVLPTYLDNLGVSRDLIEISNFTFAATDLSGVEFHQLRSFTDFSFTFPEGTVIDAFSTIVLVVGNGTDDPANGVYFIGGNNNSGASSGESVGYVLKSQYGDVIDAVGTNGYTFNSHGVTSADWSGNIPSSSSQMGVFLIGLDNNTSSGWLVTTSGYQNTQSLGIVNGAALPGTPSVSWTGAINQSGGTVVTDTMAFPDTHTYIASFSLGGCTYIDSATVTSFAGPLTANFTLDSNSSCISSADGGLTCIPSGGKQPFSYVWSTSETTQSITGLDTGSYTVTVTDFYGTTATATTTITGPNLGVAIDVNNNLSCDSLINSSLTANVSGGEPINLNPSNMVISEVSIGFTDYIEITNVSHEPFDATGYKVYASDGNSFSSVNSLSWDLSGVWASNEVRYKADGQGVIGNNYWGNDLNFTSGQNGWVVIIDSVGTLDLGPLKFYCK